MRRWINRIVLIVVLGAIVATLVWSMRPQPVPVKVARSRARSDSATRALL